MIHTLTVNLGGRVFIINEDAYGLMSRYLQSLREAMQGRNLDVEELLNDIETRCSDILAEQHDPATYIVTCLDIDELIYRMGRPEEIIDVEMSDGCVTKSVAGNDAAKVMETPPPLSKRLYRDPQNRMLGGVCGGLAAYSGWDPVYVRLITVALCFLSFSTMLFVYLILWIVLPSANTPFKQMQLHGESVTLSNIGRVVKDCFRPRDTDDNGKNDNSRGFNHVISLILRAILIFFGIICVPIVLALLFGLLLMIVVMLQSIFGVIIIDTDWVGINTDSWLMMLKAFSGLTILLIPLLLLCMTSLGLLRRDGRGVLLPRPALITMVVIWIVMFVTAWSTGVLSRMTAIWNF